LTAVSSRPRPSGSGGCNACIVCDALQLAPHALDLVAHILDELPAPLHFCHVEPEAVRVGFNRRDGVEEVAEVCRQGFEIGFQVGA